MSTVQREYYAGSEASASDPLHSYVIGANRDFLCPSLRYVPVYITRRDLIALFEDIRLRLLRSRPQLAPGAKPIVPLEARGSLV